MTVSRIKLADLLKALVALPADKKWVTYTFPLRHYETLPPDTITFERKIEPKFEGVDMEIEYNEVVETKIILSISPAELKALRDLFLPSAFTATFTNFDKNLQEAE